MAYSDLEASSRLTMEDGTVLTRCDQCRAMYADRTPPGEPPCATCRVELQEGNEDAANVYMTTRWQVISIGEQAVDLSIPALKIVMDLLGVVNQRECMMRVRRLFYAMEEERRAHG